MLEWLSFKLAIFLFWSSALHCDQCNRLALRLLSVETQCAALDKCLKICIPLRFSVALQMFCSPVGCMCVAWCDTQQQNLNGSFSPANIVCVRACSRVCMREMRQGMKMTTGLLGCRCAHRAGEVTLAMVVASETSQPSVSGHEEVTRHHCLVWRGTAGSLRGPDLPILWAELCECACGENRD